jgi:hypothetical protein
MPPVITIESCFGDTRAFSQFSAFLNISSTDEGFYKQSMYAPVDINLPAISRLSEVQVRGADT